MVFLGKVLKTRGNKGEVALTPSPDFDAWTPELEERVLLQSGKYQLHHTIEYTREIQGAFILKFNRIDSINDAFKIVGYSVYTLRAVENVSSPALESAIDFIVKDVAGEVWGKVKKMNAFGPNPIFEVVDNNDEIIYVPFSDAIVKEIDVEKRVITIDPPDGLKDLNKT